MFLLKGLPWMGVPTLDGGTYLGQVGTPGWMGVSPVRLDGDTPSPPHPETEQHSEYLLRGGRYAPYAHAGGLSCY